MFGIAIRIQQALARKPPPETTPRGRLLGRIQATYVVDGDYGFSSFAEMQLLYRDRSNGLVPCTKIVQDGVTLLRINSLGCKGPEIDPSLPAVAFFGDSATMGAAGDTTNGDADSWPEHVDLPGYAILNAAAEGANLETIVPRYEQIRARVPLVCAVVYAGWHNIVYNKRDEKYWESRLTRFLSDDHLTAFCNLATCLTPEFATRGVGPLLDERPGSTVNDTYFNFWGDLDPATWIPRLEEHIPRYNAFLADFCSRHERPLIDLHSLLAPTRYEDAPVDFFDICHPRPRAYPKIGAFVTEELGPHLLRAPVTVAATHGPEVAVEPEGEDLRKNLYPLW